jgi:Tfp pilus assembly protein PilX
MIDFFKKPTNIFQYGRENGAALVVTLLVLVLFAVLITGFLAATRIETAASRNFAYQNIAEKMAHLGAERAIAQLNSANLTSTSITNYISQPGRITTNGVAMDLTSASLNATATTSVNLNQGLAIQTNSNTNLFSIPAVPNLITSGGNTTTNGRFAYWIDDDGTKANPNAMMPNRTNFLTTNSRPLSARTFSTTFRDNLSNAITSTSANQLWGYFFTPLQAPAMAPSLANQIYQITAGPPNLTNAFTFFTNTRINLNQSLAATNTADGAFMPRNFLTNAAGAATLTAELDNLISSNIDNLRTTTIFGSGFTSKYTRDVLRQILVNINDLNLPSGSTNTDGRTAATGNGNLNADGIPQNFSGLKRFIHLNEIAVRAAQSTNSLGYNRAIELQIWFSTELVNPYNLPWGDSAQIIFGIGGISFDARYELAGVTNSRTFGRSDWNWSGGRDSSGIETNGIRLEGRPPVLNNVPAFSIRSADAFSRPFTYAFEWQVFFGPNPDNIPTGASNVVVTNVSLSPSYVKLLQWTNTPSTIRDWATRSDFGTFRFTNTSQITTVPENIGPIGSWYPVPDAGPGPREPFASLPSFNSAGAFGIAKNDPRVRTFPGWGTTINSWTRVLGGGSPPTTIGAGNGNVVNFQISSTGIPGIGPDSAPASTDIFSNFSLTNSFRSTNSANEPYISLMELGKIHTGLQWRTLQMRSQNATESRARLIPDWALLDAFYISNSIPKLNINSVVYPAATNSAANTIGQQEAAGLLRGPALESLLSGGTNAPLAADFVSANSSMRTSGVNSYRTIASNIARMDFTNTWLTNRAALGTNYFLSNQYAMLGEILEVNRVANFGDSDAVNEGRAASFIDAMSLHSDVFSIYSVGYATDRQGRNVAEFILRTQVQLDRSTGRFRKVFVEPVKTSNLPMP